MPDLTPALFGTRPPRAALFPQAAFDLVVMGASAGGVTALKKILAELSTAFDTPIAVVQHLAPFYPSTLPQVLGFRGRLNTRFVQRGERLRSGTVYLAPQDRHLILGPECRLTLENSPRCNYVRPAADRLFTTAAEQLGPRLLCVVLTGAGRDGAQGAAAVKRHGGVVIVQDPAGAEVDAMPKATLATVDVDLVLPLETISSAITSLCNVIGTRALFCREMPELKVPVTAAAYGT